MIISRTPFRISFFGGGTDYPAWYRQHGGSVLAVTIDKYCYLTCRYLPPFFEHRIRVVYSKIENCQKAEEVQHPSVRAILQHLKLERGVEIHHDGDLPARSGLGSSSAFTVGLLNALYALQGRMLSKHQLALESIHIEQDMLKEAVGSQDQILTAYGGLSHVMFHQNGEITVRPITLTQARIQELNQHMMLFYTGIKRTAATIATTYDFDGKKRQLRIMRDMVDEALSILNGSEDVCRFGELLHEAWLAKRTLSDRVSNDAVDAIYEAARSAGAVGGKIMGAGGGGFMQLFVPPVRQKAVREKLKDLIYVPFKFEFSGSQIIFFDPQEDFSTLDLQRNGAPKAFCELADLRPPAAPEEP